MPEADGPAEATKTNLGSYPLIKKILNADSPVCVTGGRVGGLAPAGENAFGLGTRTPC